MTESSRPPLPRWLFFLRPFTRVEGPYLRAALLGGFTAAVLSVASMLLELWVLRPHPGPDFGRSLYFYCNLLGLPWIVLVLWAVSEYAASFPTRSPTDAKSVLAMLARGTLAVVGFLVVSIALLRPASALRRDAFESFSERSRPLIEAIRAYEQREGQPPPELSALVPSYLPELPSTGMRVCPAYGYEVGERVAERQGSDWILVVECYSLPVGWDTLVYYPDAPPEWSNFGDLVHTYGNWVFAMF